MTININVPLWTEGIEDEGFLALTWFLRQVHRQYGEGNEWFQYHTSDVNLLLGQTTHLETLASQWGIGPELLQIGRALDNRVMIKIGMTKAVRRVEIKDPRLVVAIVYLKGCMTKNLMEPDGYQPGTGFDRDLRGCVTFRHW